MSMLRIDEGQNKDNQLNRRSLLRIGNILLKAGISASAVGIAGVATLEMLQAIGHHLLETKQERDLARASMFIKGLLEGEASEESLNNFLDQLVDPEDFYILFRNALQDDEDQKARHYAVLLKNIALGNVTGELKAYMIKVAKELSMREVRLLAEMLVIKTYSVMPIQGPSLDAKSLLKGKGLIDRICNVNLLRLGLVDEDNGVLKPTDLSSHVARALYREEELAPQFFGLQSWRDERALILTTQDSDAEMLALQAQQALRSCRVYSNIVFINSTLDLSTMPLLSKLLIVIASAEPGHSGVGGAKEVLEKLSISSEMRLIKILAQSPIGRLVDIAPNLDAGSTLSVELDSCNSLRDLTEQIQCILDGVEGV
jgi:hypothetical protein